MPFVPEPSEVAALLSDPSLPKSIADQIRLQRATVEVVLHWVAIEHDLADLLSAAIDRPDENVGHVIYSAPSATETRMAIVDAAIAQLAFQGKLNKLTLRVWRAINGALGRIIGVRNFCSACHVPAQIGQNSGPPLSA